MKTEEAQSKSVWSRPFYGEIEYDMPKAMAKEILKFRKGAEQNIPPQKFLCDYVNKTFGLKGYCVRVLTK